MTERIVIVPKLEDICTRLLSGYNRERGTEEEPGLCYGCEESPLNYLCDMYNPFRLYVFRAYLIDDEAH